MTLNHHFNRSVAEVTANKTLTAADSGVVQVAKADGIVFTLPSTALGLNFTFVNGSRYDGEYAFTVNPQAADGITGNGFTAAVNKDIVVAKATSRAKDMFTVLGTGAAGVTAYVFQTVVGTITREA